MGCLLWNCCLSSPLSINHSVFEPCMKDVDSEFYKGVSQEKATWKT